MKRIHPFLEEVEFKEEINALLSVEEIPYVLKDTKLKEEKLQKIERLRQSVESSSISYETRAQILQKLYGAKFVLGLKEGTGYLQLIASGGLGFVLGFLANDNLRNYFNKIAQEFVADFQKYSKS